MAFNFQFHTDIKEQENLLWEEAEKRLTQLGLRYNSITGSTVTVKEEVSGETPKLVRAKVIVSMKPKNQIAVKKGTNPLETLKDALNAAERQVRQRLEQKQEKWEEPKDPAKKLKTEFEE